MKKVTLKEAQAPYTLAIDEEALKQEPVILERDGRPIAALATRITQHPSANEQLLYFTSNSLTGDDRNIVFISDRTGHPNLYSLDLVNGEEVALTGNREGFLKSYVYFDGQPYRGFGKASVTLDSERGLVYYIQGRDICVADLKGKVRVLAQYPYGQVTAFTHVSADGRRLCVPTTDERALGDDLIKAGNLTRTIDQRVQVEDIITLSQGTIPC
jgi:hypothetical protein